MTALVVPDKVAIPADLADLAGQLDGLARLAVASEWARAAIVAAWVELPGSGGNHQKTELSFDSPDAFASRGFAGLKSHTTVRSYAKAWLDRYPRPVPGEVVELPSVPFPKPGAMAPDNNWYTPRWIFDQLGLTFDLDVCAPPRQADRTCPARNYLTEEDDGLTSPWSGLVWCNPPYSEPGPWVDRMIEHSNGVLFAPFSHKAKWTLDALEASSSLRWIGRPEFYRPDGTTASPNFSLMLATFGEHLSGALIGVTGEMVGPLWRRTDG